MTSTTATHRADVPDVNEMIVIHRVFRRELAAIPALVRRAPDHDHRRIRHLAEHTRLIIAGLHLHHTGEDAVLWPRLRERATTSTELIDIIERQHQRIHDHIEAIEPALATWEKAATSPQRDELARSLDTLTTAVLEHLDLEERDVLPLVAEHITPSEWARLGDHGRNRMTARQLPLMFGLLLEDADHTERAALYADLPTPIRLLMRTIGRHRYRSYISRVRIP